MARWCCQKPKAKGRAAQAAAPSAPPAPAPPAPVEAGYPPAIVAAGLQAVWNLQTLAGCRTTPVKRLGTDALPAGASFAGGFLDLDAATALSGWVIDRPARAQGSGAYAVSITDSAFTLPAGNDDFNLRNGKDDATNAVTLTLNRCLVNCEAVGGGGGVVSRSGSLLHAVDCAFVNPGTDAFPTFRGGSFTRCHFKAVGLTCAPDRHLEQVKFDGGDAAITDCFFDLRSGMTAAAGPSGNVFWGGDGDAVLTFTNCIFAGVARYGGLFTVQYRNDSGAVRLQFVNCVFEKGLSGYIGQGPGPKAVVTASGCRDFASAALIDAELIV